MAALFRQKWVKGLLEDPPLASLSDTHPVDTSATLSASGTLCHAPGAAGLVVPRVNLFSECFIRNSRQLELEFICASRFEQQVFQRSVQNHCCDACVQDSFLPR